MESQTQWRVGVNGRTGVDYPAVRMVANVLGIEFSPRVLRGIQAIERFELKRQLEKQTSA
jgi:hypothetical protein